MNSVQTLLSLLLLASASIPASAQTGAMERDVIADTQEYAAVAYGLDLFGTGSMSLKLTVFKADTAGHSVLVIAGGQPGMPVKIFVGADETRTACDIGGVKTWTLVSGLLVNRVAEFDANGEVHLELDLTIPTSQGTISHVQAISLRKASGGRYLPATSNGLRLKFADGQC